MQSCQRWKGSQLSTTHEVVKVPVYNLLSQSSKGKIEDKFQYKIAY